MKKITSIFLSMVLIFALTACGSSNKEAASGASSEQQTALAAEETAEEENAAVSLVVYYSASSNTRRVAENIAEAAGADLFEIVPTEVYTSDDLNWTNSDSCVNREHDDETLREVPLTTTEVPNWDSYDTVFIGYPI